ncbi:MAG: hypothetical protein LBS58_03330, partial [Coriobacteriales bacterium]|nr:hypothetical protein [Coriobacteriales bacterium]
MRRGRFVIGTVFAIGLVAGILGFTTFAAAGPSPQPGDEFEADGLLYSISYTAPDEVSLFGG